MHIRSRGFATLVASLGVAALVAACADGPGRDPATAPVVVLAPGAKPSNTALPFSCDASKGPCPGTPGDPINAVTAQVERFQVCKVYPNGTGPAVTIKIDAYSPDGPNTNPATNGGDGGYHFTFDVNPNSCVLIWSNGEIKGGTPLNYILRKADQVTVTELPTPGYTTSSMQVLRVIATDTAIRNHKTYDTTKTTINSPTTAQLVVSNPVGGYQVPGATVIYTNVPTPPSTFTISGKVWEDLDANATQNGSEGPLNGVTLTLKNGNTVVGTTQSAGSGGTYSFTNVPAGNYTVCASGYPSGYTETFDITAPTNDDCASVTVGPDKTGVDFGYTPPPRFSIGDFVWNDANGNGLQDAGETGIAGATVTLTNLATQGTSTTTTDGSGIYSFGGLLAGSYTACVTGGVPAGYSPSADLDGVNTPSCATFTVTANRSDVDFGYKPPPRFTIGDLVFNDVNGNGVQDNGDVGIDGVTITVKQGNTLIATTTTSGGGLYSVGNLLSGNYDVCVTGGVPSGYTQTYDLDGVATANCATVQVNASRNDVDFGYTPPRFSIGDRVWNDVNHNGVQDAGEVGINGATVTLTNLATQATSTATTAVDGNYGFTNLLTGNYTLCVTGVPSGFTPTYDVDGVATPNCATVNVTADRTDVDFGYTPPRFSIGDFVWDDANGNGAQDAGELGLSGVTLTLTNLSDGTTSTTTTNGSGIYAFGNLLAGNYTVCVTGGVPAGYTPSADLDGVNTPNCANNFNVSANRSDVDFGYKPPPPRYSVGDRVWDDANGNGVQDAGEGGLAATVTLYDGNGVQLTTATTTVAGNGAYTFSNLLGGNYKVCVSVTASGYVPTYDLDGTGSANCASFTLSASRTDVDFGYRQPPPPPATGAIGDETWIDANGNGIRDAGEPGLAGVKLTLSGQSSASQTSTTSGYKFTGLGAGSYSVAATAPAGWLFTTPLVGANRNVDSNGNPSAVTLATSSSVDLSVDFGFVPKAGSGQGCTPGYWKQSQHFDSWKWYTQSNMVDAVFGVTYRSTAKNNPTGPLTLLDALELNGNGDAEQLFRHGTAALLNSVYQSGVSFPYTAPQVIQMVHDAWVSGDVNKIQATHQALANANQLGCPLN